MKEQDFNVTDSKQFKEVVYSMLRRLAIQIGIMDDVESNMKPPNDSDISFLYFCPHNDKTLTLTTDLNKNACDLCLKSLIDEEISKLNTEKK